MPGCRMAHGDTGDAGYHIIPKSPNYHGSDRQEQEQPHETVAEQEARENKVKEMDVLAEHCRSERERQAVALARAIVRSDDIGDKLRGIGLTVRYLKCLLKELRRRASDAAIRSPVRRSALYITGRQASAHT